jgi:signal transduction histidine kinase
LSIVMQVAKMHGGQIDLLDSPLGGLRAQITFPPQA